MTLPVMCLPQMRPDGSGLRKLYDSHGGLAAHPHFSPDSQRIVFTCDCSGARTSGRDHELPIARAAQGDVFAWQSTWHPACPLRLTELFCQTFPLLLVLTIAIELT